MPSITPLPTHADRYFESQLHLVNHPSAKLRRASLSEWGEYAKGMTVGFSLGEMLLFALAAVLLSGHFLAEEVRHQLTLAGLREPR